MILIQLPDLANFIQRFFVTYVATKCIGRVGWVNNNSTLSHNFRSLSDQTMLWVIGVDREKLAHSDLSVIRKINYHI